MLALETWEWIFVGCVLAIWGPIALFVVSGFLVTSLTSIRYARGVKVCDARRQHGKTISYTQAGERWNGNDLSNDQQLIVECARCGRSPDVLDWDRQELS